MTRRFRIGTFALAACTACLVCCTSTFAQNGEPRVTTRDPITGTIADGSLKAIANPPGVVYWLGEDAAFITAIGTEDPVDSESVFQPRIVGYKFAKMNGQRLKRGGSVVENATLENGVFKNPGPYIVQIQYVDTQTGALVDLELEPGFGLLVGSADLLDATHEWGCACRCEDETDGYWTITLASGAIDAPEEDGVEIPDDSCASYSDVLCLQTDIQATPGTSRNCVRALIPR